MEQPEVGSEWLIWGKWWTVLGPSMRDGEEAVYLRSRDSAKKTKRRELLRTFAKKALPRVA